MKHALKLTGLILTILLSYGVHAKPGQPAFGQVMLTNTGGEARLLSEWMGNKGIVVLNFWASYCQPCKEEMPAMQALMQSRPDARLLFINVDESSARDKALAMFEDLDMTGEPLFDIYQIAIQKYDQKIRVPTTVIIYNNRIVYEAHGYHKNTIQKIKAQLDKLK